MATLAVAPVPGTVAKMRSSRGATSRVGAQSTRSTSRIRPRATDEGEASVELVFVRPSSDDPEDVVEVRCVARVGENLLAAAMRCGAVDEAAHFCLEGRCDTCAFEDCATEENVRGCQTNVEKPMRLWRGVDDEAQLFRDDDDW